CRGRRAWAAPRRQRRKPQRRRMTSLVLKRASASMVHAQIRLSVAGAYRNSCLSHAGRVIRMGWQERRVLLGRIEASRRSRALLYGTGDRLGQETIIHPDVIDHFVEHLDAIGVTNRISLVLIREAATVWPPGASSIL